MVDYIGAKSEEDANLRIWELCSRHGRQIMEALARIRDKHDLLSSKIPDRSLLSLIADRDYLKSPIGLLVETICARMKAAIPVAFQHNRPKDERDLNDKVSAILNTERTRFEREHPAIRFGLASVVPDHSWHEQHILLETKYLRGATSPSKVSDGIAADLMKYPNEVHVLYLVYDPDRAISNDDKFRADFERRRKCTVFVIR